ncbi:hypothetical protein OMK64_18555 [Cellulomonas fimi]|nr:hypothetical protein [Cellulomonas fimi]MDC7123537.1 hypothetical protein [Cellulomonas fimi]
MDDDEHDDVGGVGVVAEDARADPRAVVGEVERRADDEEPDLVLVGVDGPQREQHAGVVEGVEHVPGAPGQARQRGDEPQLAGDVEDVAADGDRDGGGSDVHRRKSIRLGWRTFAAAPSAPW